MNSNEFEKALDSGTEKYERTIGSQTDVSGNAEPQLSEGKMNWKVGLAFIALVGQGNAFEMTLLIPASLLSYINADLGPDPSYAWISVSWSLCAVVMVSVAGRLIDIFGRRPFMLCGAILSFIGTIVGATGQSIGQMIAASVFFWNRGRHTETYYACLMEIVSNRHRALAIGSAACCALPSFFSPLIAYALMARTSLGWRSAYWFMCAWNGAAAIALFFFYHPPTFHRKHLRDPLQIWDAIISIDYIGLFLFMSGCTLFLVGINFGGSRYLWTDSRVLAPLIVGIGVLVGFGSWEVFGKPQLSLMPPRLFKNFRGFVVLIIVCFIGGMLYYSIQVLWPRQSGLLFAPADDLIIRGCYANITAWATWDRLDRLNASVGISDKTQAIATVFILSCFVSQPMFLSFVTMSLGIPDQNDIGIAVGIVSTFRLLGGAIGTAIYSSILTSTFESQLRQQILEVVTSTDLPQSSASSLLQAALANTAVAYAKMPGMTASIRSAASMGVKTAYVDAFHTVYLAAVAFGVLALFFVSFIRNIEVQKKNKVRAVLLENELSAINAKQIGV